jgi:hypothetical protein
MNPELKRRILLLLFGSLFVSAQCVWANAINMRGGHPDFILIYALIYAQFSTMSAAAGAGFAAALISASLSGPAASAGTSEGAISATISGGVGSLLVSRTLTCSLIGWLEERVFRENFLSSLAIASGGTLAAEILFFVFNPQRHATVWVRHVAYETVLNVLIAVPAYILIYTAHNADKIFHKRSKL